MVAPFVGVLPSPGTFLLGLLGSPLRYTVFTEITIGESVFWGRETKQRQGQISPVQCMSLVSTLIQTSYLTRHLRVLGKYAHQQMLDGIKELLVIFLGVIIIS